MVLEAIYEQDYLPCSYGFRPGRSAHQALNSLQQEIWSKRLYWVLELDIRKYFDSIPTFGRSSTNESQTASSDG
jgi:retron-type reverse transcriptase